MDGKQKRLTAKRSLIEDLVKGEYFTREGFKSNYLITPRGGKVSRVKVVGTVMTKFVNDDESYAFIVLDDGSETIRAKFFQDLSDFEKVEEGDLVKVIGKLREYEDEIYINPEVVKPVEDSNSLTLHLSEVAEELNGIKEDRERLEELKEKYPDNYKEQLSEELGEEEARILLDSVSGGGISEEKEEEEPQNGELKKDILDLIDDLDEGQGASYQDIIDELDEEEGKIDEVINDLLTEGTCFEPRPGRIKKL